MVLVVVVVVKGVAAYLGIAIPRDIMKGSLHDLVELYRGEDVTASQPLPTTSKPITTSCCQTMAPSRSGAAFQAYLP